MTTCRVEEFGKIQDVSISVVIPVFNEEQSVVDVIRKVDSELADIRHEIVAVDDGSSDRSVERIEECGIDNLRVIRHLENRGYGKSLFDGIISSQYDFILIIDSDGTYPAEKIGEMVSYIPSYDMVVGARTGSVYCRSLVEKIARWMFKSLSEFTTGRPIPDINSGLRVFRKDAVLKFGDNLCHGFSFTTTLTLLFQLEHYYVKYIPIPYYKRVEGQASRVKYFRDTLRAGQIVTEAILHYNPIKLFLLLALLSLAIGVITGLCSLVILHSSLLNVIAGAMIASFIPIVGLGFVCAQIQHLVDVIKNGK